MKLKYYLTSTQLYTLIGKGKLIVVRTSPLMRSGVDHTVLTANTPHLHLPVIHVPNYMDYYSFTDP